jgi:hypothetical protein
MRDNTQQHLTRTTASIRIHNDKKDVVNTPIPVAIALGAQLDGAALDDRIWATTHWLILPHTCNGDAYLSAR